MPGVPPRPVGGGDVARRGEPDVRALGAPGGTAPKAAAPAECSTAGHRPNRAAAAPRALGRPAGTRSGLTSRAGRARPGRGPPGSASTAQSGRLGSYRAGVVAALDRHHVPVVEDDLGQRSAGHPPPGDPGRHGARTVAGTGRDAPAREARGAGIRTGTGYDRSGAGSDRILRASAPCRKAQGTSRRAPRRRPWARRPAVRNTIRPRGSRRPPWGRSSARVTTVRVRRAVRVVQRRGSSTGVP